MWQHTRSNDFDEKYARLLPKLMSVTGLQQRRLASLFYMSEISIMREFNSNANIDNTDYDFDTNTLVGVAGNGQAVEDNLYTAIIHGKQAIASGATLVQVNQLISSELARRAATIMSDTARTASMMSAKNRNYHAQYVRVLTPPSCGRCAVLAGIPSGKTAFERHPNCDCTAAWSDDETALATHYANSSDYLDSLEDDELAHVLGSQANAKAYRDGASLSQLVNAYDKKGSVHTAQRLTDGRKVKVTYSGTTKRALAHWRMYQAGLADRRKRAELRLMPETIYELAGDDHAKTLKLLHDYGWTN